MILAPQSWSLLGVLGTYQQTLSGVSARATVAQPLIFFNLPLGYYLFPPHDPTKHFSMEADIFLPSRKRNGDYR
jgi:hypothetical protein